MKTLIILSFLLMSIFGIAQSDFYSAELTQNNETTKTVYIKKRSLVIDKNGDLNIYETPNSSDKIDINNQYFKSIVSTNKNIFLIQTMVNGLNNNQPVILRKLVDGNHSLYQYIDKDKAIYYVDEHNDSFTLLNNSNNQQMKYREWLFTKFNPRNESASKFADIKYLKESLNTIYLENNNSSTLLEQELSTNPFRFSLNAGFSTSSINLSSKIYNFNEIEASGLRLGLRVNYNLDQIKNRHTLIGGINYYLPNQGASTFINPNTNNILVTEIETNYLSFLVGYQYNIHINKVTISPYVNMEPTFIVGKNSITSVINDTTQLYSTEAFTGSPVPFNLGLNIDILNKGYIFAEYSLTFESRAKALTQFVSPGNFTIINNTDRISIGIGYYIF